jgi:DNA replication initiation complex subunit (GINS family)
LKVAATPAGTRPAYCTGHAQEAEIEAGVAATALPGTTKSTAVIGVPDVNAVPLLSQHLVLRLENGIVLLVGVVDAGR